MNKTSAKVLLVALVYVRRHLAKNSVLGFVTNDLHAGPVRSESLRFEPAVCGVNSSRHSHREMNTGASPALVLFVCSLFCRVWLVLRVCA